MFEDEEEDDDENGDDCEHKRKPGDQQHSADLPVENDGPSLVAGLIIRFRAADDQLAAEEFFVVQFRYRPFRFFNRLHLHESETLGTLVVLVGDDFCILHLTDSVEEIEQVALRSFEGEIANVKTRRAYFDRLRFARDTLGPGRAIAGLRVR